MLSKSRKPATKGAFGSSKNTPKPRERRVYVSK